MTALTPIYAFPYLEEGQPLADTRKILEDATFAWETALAAGGVAAPGASDLLDVAGRVSALEAAIAGGLTKDVMTAIPMSTVLESAAASAAYNPRHTHWPGDPASVAIAVGADVYASGGWRIVSHTGGPSAVASKADPIRGGLKLVITYTGSDQYLYVRQLIPDLSAFSRSVWSWTHDVDTSAAVDCDVYVQARLNSNDWDRVKVTDTPQYVLGTGRRRMATTFTVPDLDDPATMTIGDGTPTHPPAAVTTIAWAENNYLESAFRLVGKGAGTVTVIIRDSVLTPGVKPRGPLHVNPAAEQVKVEAYHETGSFQFVGATTSSGQKRFPVAFRTRKARALTAANISVWDAQGTAGKITTYDVAGVATHGVTPPTPSAWTVSPAGGFREGFAFTIGNTSTISGVGFSWEAKLY